MGGAPQDFEGEKKVSTAADIIDVEKARPPSKNYEGQYKISTTKPDNLRRHDISDEELEMLSGESRDGLSEAFWAFVGVVLGALPSACQAFYRAFWAVPRIPLSITHLVEIIEVCGAIIGIVIVRWVSRGRSSRIKQLVQTIRARKTTEA